MRELKFRGKPIKYPYRIIVDNKEIMPFAYGGYYKDKCWGNKDEEKEYIIAPNSRGLGYNEFIRVDPKTVGQYTGFKDIDGGWIYEGDIIQYGTCILKVFYDQGIFKAQNREGSIELLCMYDTGAFKIIGNIYDNPELLKD